MIADSDRTADFATIAATHLDAAYSLARWLTRDAVLAQDVVQDSMVRALTYFKSFRGDNARAWLLQIVRNVALSKLDSQRRTISIDAADEASNENAQAALIDTADGPEATLQREQDQTRVTALLQRLPLELRECLILRELEECSYKEIARVIDAPIGTVMSRLWRARQMLVEFAGQAEKLK